MENQLNHFGVLGR